MIRKMNRVPFSPLGGRYAIEKFSGMLGIERKVHIDDLLTETAGTGAVYQLMVTLRGTEPAIWRRLLVQDTTLDRLSDYLIAAMGWMGGHLHLFMAGGKYYGIPDPEWNESLLDEDTVKLSDIVSVKQRGFIYEYDLGDSWQHEVLVESIGPPEPGRRYPVCLEGGLACPPEDVGGIGGFYEFLEAIGDPDHPEHEYLLEWAGGNFDPEAFDLDQVNQALRAIAGK
ncbi:MAG: plasmid pRiA4b ORF-3 family protein, partial [Thermoleophilia bacterium]